MSDEDKQRTLGIIMIIGAWGILLGLLTFLFHTWYTDKVNPNQDIQGVILNNGTREVRLKANYQSHYLAEGKINGQDVTFFLDTGATQVVIPYHMAKELNLELGATSQAQTAGGLIQVYLTQIDEIQIGNIYLKNVKASVNPADKSNHVLLGMSALRRLELTHKDDELIIRLPE